MHVSRTGKAKTVFFLSDILGQHVFDSALFDLPLSLLSLVCLLMYLSLELLFT